MIRITSYLVHLYGKKEAERIQEELRNYLKTLPENKFPQRNTQWYKSANVYVLYPKSIKEVKKAPLQNIALFLSHIKKVGFNAVHILPFLDSPNLDGGFDVRNYYSVRKDLGDMRDLRNLKKTADDLGIRVFMDLVFNHVSSKHEWYRKAIGGDEKYCNYFIYTKEKPNFLRKFHKNAAVWAEYFVNGEKKFVNVAFPEFAGPIPHWVLGRDGYWYYHTYLPQQIDINWKNPDVFIECAKILIFWVNQGYHFRLDAIPFVGKSAYKKINSRANFTHHLLAAFNRLAKQINPECTFILETYEHVDTVIGYLGRKNIEQAEMLYGFHLCTSLWVSLTTRDSSRLWKTLKKISKIPTFAQWMNFLRSHDELSLAYLDNKSLHAVRESLLKLGSPFREGYGIAGRTFSLLGGNTRRFLMAYFLLCSLPGGVLLPYGDEYGKCNTPKSSLTNHEKKDARNINRGVLTKEFLKENRHGEILREISRMVHARHRVREYFNIWPKRLGEINEVFCGEYNLGNSKICVFVNLTEQRKTIPFRHKGYKKIGGINSTQIEDNFINLGEFGGLWLKR